MSLATAVPRNYISCVGPTPSLWLIGTPFFTSTMPLNTDSIGMTAEEGFFFNGVVSLEVSFWEFDPANLSLMLLN